MKEWKDTAERLEAEKVSLKRSLDSIQANGGGSLSGGSSRRSPPLSSNGAPADKVGLWSRIRGMGGSQRGESPAASQTSDVDGYDQDTDGGAGFEEEAAASAAAAVASATAGAGTTGSAAALEKQLASLRQKASELQTNQGKAVAAAAKQAEENAELAGLNSRLKQQVAELTQENKELKVLFIPPSPTICLIG